MSDIEVPIIELTSLEGLPPLLEKFLQREPFDLEAERIAREVLSEIKLGGNAALLKAIEKFDGVNFQVDELLVKKEEFAAARSKVDQSFISAIHQSHKNVAAFAQAGLKKEWSISAPKGGVLGERYVPLQRVGVYVPGGTAPLVSTAIMTITLAKVAGVPEIVAVSPVGQSKKMNEYLLYAMEVAGATEVYKIGGIQAIGALAYGTETIKKVQKIVGPGNAYVTAAKRCVYGEVALDLVAGPSEIAILADENAPPDAIAADMLSQAEHGSGHERALLVVTSARVAARVKDELLRQTEKLPRAEMVKKVLLKGCMIVVVSNLEKGMELCNRFAPEHLEIMVNEPRNWVKKVQNAGAVFVGVWTPECVGDFTAGPSHVLPTGGAAAMFSGLTVDDFRKRISVISFTRADLKHALETIEVFGRVEGLEAHSNSARIRFCGNEK